MTDLDPERSPPQSRPSPRRLRPGDGRAGFRQGADHPHHNAQGSSVCPGEDNVRVGRSQRFVRNRLDRAILAALLLRAGSETVRPHRRRACRPWNGHRVGAGIISGTARPEQARAPRTPRPAVRCAPKAKRAGTPASVGPMCAMSEAAVPATVDANALFRPGSAFCAF